MRTILSETLYTHAGHRDKFIKKFFVRACVLRYIAFANRTKRNTYFHVYNKYMVRSASISRVPCKLKNTSIRAFRLEI